MPNAECFSGMLVNPMPERPGETCSNNVSVWLQDASSSTIEIPRKNFIPEAIIAEKLIIKKRAALLQPFSDSYGSCLLFVCIQCSHVSSRKSCTVQPYLVYFSRKAGHPGVIGIFAHNAICFLETTND